VGVLVNPESPVREPILPQMKVAAQSLKGTSKNRAGPAAANLTR